MLMVRRQAKVIGLVYLLAEETSNREVDSPWPHSKENVHWLYDEFDVDENDVASHEVLLSNGRILTLRFLEVQRLERELSVATAVA